MPSGVSKGVLEVPPCEDGTDVVYIEYEWCKGFLDMRTLFIQELSSFGYSISHPEVMAVSKGLKEHRTNIDEVPKSKMTIKLPKKVQTSPQSYTHDVLVNKLPAGNHLVTIRVRLTAFSTGYNVTQEKKKIEIMF